MLKAFNHGDSRMPIDHYQAVLAGEEYVHGADHAVAKDECET